MNQEVTKSELIGVDTTKSIERRVHPSAAVFPGVLGAWFLWAAYHFGFVELGPSSGWSLRLPAILLPLALAAFAWWIAGRILYRRARVTGNLLSPGIYLLASIGSFGVMIWSLTKSTDARNSTKTGPASVAFGALFIMSAAAWIIALRRSSRTTRSVGGQDANAKASAAQDDA